MILIKKLIPSHVKIWIRKFLNFLIPGENIKESKDKWNKLAKKNARYFVMTDFGEDITESQFRETGKKDYEQLIKDDNLLMEKLGNFSDKTALEIGCGAGRVTEFISQHFKKVFAVDISEKMIDEGRQRLGNVTNIEFISIDGTHYPTISDSSIDFVFSYIVFQHMSNKKVVMKNFEEIMRVLKEGGIAKIQVRGLPTNKLNWFYGPSFTKKDIENLATKLNIKLLKTAGENERYFWLWFSK